MHLRPSEPDASGYQGRMPGRSALADSGVQLATPYCLLAAATRMTPTPFSIAIELSDRPPLASPGPGSIHSHAGPRMAPSVDTETCVAMDESASSNDGSDHTSEQTRRCASPAAGLLLGGPETITASLAAFRRVAR